jgi:hypothetical protein
MKKRHIFRSAVVLVIPILALVLLIGVVVPAAANPKEAWTQCANQGDPKCETKGNTGWISGKIGSNNGDYTLGDFIAYRAYRTGFEPGMRYCSGAWWDFAKAELPAIDYIGSYNITVTEANPLFDTDVPTTTPAVTVNIPSDPVLQGGYYLDTPGSGFTGTLPFGNVGDPGAQGVFTMWGASDINLKGYGLPFTTTVTSLDNGSQGVEICYTATMSKVVAAWGGHIALPQEWGAPTRPTGSPYHMKTGTGFFFTSPRTSVNDSAEFDPNVCDDEGICPSANHYTIGSMDLQLAIDDPTAITMESVSAGDGSDGLTLALIGVGLAALFSAMFVLIRRQRIDVA